MSFFDPLALASPARQMYAPGHMDETIKVNEHKKWLNWLNEIRKLASIKVPRCISSGHTEGEIHVFVDASEKSYAAAMLLACDAWKRLVRCVKTALAATLRERSPHEEVLHTLLLEAVHIVNSRSLMEVDIELTEAEDLTPNHFLIGRFYGAAAAGHHDDNMLLGLTNWRACQRLADHVWQRGLEPSRSLQYGRESVFQAHVALMRRKK
ncbi:hypothetical protein EVAR_11157_1 [Eumeta japonica]|uniref:Uncharacterized protein n=1 Tax=Eumeta variegata TaxID=151549 RepID=A0A4C1U5K0_EUMVA|nr:hypothetical protein EVAR_11157_1 [Eumeta japonica]